MLRSSLIFGTAMAVTCALAVTPVRADTLVTQGHGFKLTTQFGVSALSPDRPYTVTFASADLKKRYTPHLTKAVAQLRAAGLNMAVGGVEEVAGSACPPQGHVHYTEEHRPMGRGGYSRGAPCPHPADGVAAGGVVSMDSEYFDGSWYISPYKLRNTFVHEMLHVLGLDHPNLDLNRNGIVETYECVATPSGVKPVMCSPNGGRRSSEAGTLTVHDLDGIEALLANGRALGVR
ncbi:hypothetical protein GCM10012287_37530 [Streptomyces daqingensis]|uniref:Uncharacterized protein n=1 Tax=Streptomyces daqingensis TaxID=1472640 RepID=A0ABQ2MJ21_9ACTN|nr:hypothetical protein [Streptomyces daqingensis]GGO52684.1 hypothetical protein GCM10012287_37530 [Streptomyces daqingensis]